MAWLAGCTFDDSSFRNIPGAVQRVYRQGVPHTDARGGLRFAYDESASFLPIGLYHALVGEHFGRSYDLSVVRAAGFNTIHAWELQPIERVAAAAKQRDLRLIAYDPSHEDLRREAGDPASPILAWYLEQEPTTDKDGPDWRQRIEKFRGRQAALRGLDPIHPTLIVDTPRMTGESAERWAAWNTAADISSHFNYPVTTASPRTFSGPRGIPETVSHAATLNHERKPLWFVVQAFASPVQHWAMPTAVQLRGMVYAAFIHGATGIIYFAFDSFVTRDDGVVGISPSAISDYGPTPDYNGDGQPRLVVDDEMLDRSKALWATASQINHELTGLRAELLTETSSRDYRIEAAGGNSTTPVRTLLKELRGAAILFAVNVDSRPVHVRVTFESPIAPPSVLYEPDAKPVASVQGWEDTLPPFTARVYRFSFPGS